MIRLLSGDCRDVLATLPAESVQCVVTSPPYYGLRDYGTALWDGGDAACDHAQERIRTRRNLAEAANACDGGTRKAESRTDHEALTLPFRDTCGKCGAVRVDRQIGLEATPDEYLATMVAVFREVRRVLRRDGTCWVNMGDSYNANAGGATPRGLEVGRISAGAHPVYQKGDGGRKTTTAKPKDLLLMPARLALALQADGWWVRSDIIWHKPNPMPESCTDRPTSAHEHVFLLTRSSRYYYDADAVREAQTEGTLERFGNGNAPRKPGIKQGGSDRKTSSFDALTPDAILANGRNLRNVWSIATHAYPDAHFATFPPELAERCIKAGTSERGCCAACGKPWVRVTEATSDGRVPYATVGLGAKAAIIGNDGNGLHKVLREDGRGGDLATIQRTTTGWAPGCQCGTTAEHFGPFTPMPTVPCTVLDPFIGAGTTALVADRLQRDCIGIDLNTQYTRMAMDRCIADAPLFTSFAPAEDPEDERMADLFAGDEYQQPKSLTTQRRDGSRWNNHARGYGGFAPRTLPDMAAD